MHDILEICTLNLYYWYWKSCSPLVQACTLKLGCEYMYKLYLWENQMIDAHSIGSLWFNHHYRKLNTLKNHLNHSWHLKTKWMRKRRIGGEEEEDLGGKGGKKDLGKNKEEEKKEDLD